MCYLFLSYFCLSKSNQKTPLGVNFLRLAAQCGCRVETRVCTNAQTYNTIKVLNSWLMLASLRSCLHSRSKRGHAEKSLARPRPVLVVVILGFCFLCHCEDFLNPKQSINNVIPRRLNLFNRRQRSFCFYNIEDRLTKPYGLERWLFSCCHLLAFYFL